MTDFVIARCYRCSTELPTRPPGRPGPPRRFCSNRCRKAAQRERQRRPDFAPVYPLDLELPDLPPPPSPDELLAQTIMEARNTAATFARLATVARREFGWRCEAMAGEITRTLDKHFPGV